MSVVYMRKFCLIFDLIGLVRNGSDRALFSDFIFLINVFHSCCSLPPQELIGQLESQGKVDSASFQNLVATLAQQNLAAAEKQDLAQYESRVQAWEAEKRQLIQREKEMREKAQQEKEERLAAKAAAQQM